MIVGLPVIVSLPSFLEPAMKFTSCFVLSVSLFVAAFAQGADNVPDVLKFKMNSLAGQPVDLSKYQGKVVLMVNVASECGLTPQYEGLQALHKKYSDQGLAVLGFPANEFGAQEPGSNSQI